MHGWAANGLSLGVSGSEVGCVASRRSPTVLDSCWVSHALEFFPFHGQLLPCVPRLSDPEKVAVCCTGRRASPVSSASQNPFAAPQSHRHSLRSKLSKMSSRFLYMVKNGRIPFFFKAE